MCLAKPEGNAELKEQPGNGQVVWRSMRWVRLTWRCRARLGGRMDLQMLFERSKRLEWLLVPTAVLLGTSEGMRITSVTLEVCPTREGALLERDARVIETVLMDARVSVGVVGAFVFAQSGGVGKREAAVGVGTHVWFCALGTMGIEEMSPQGAMLEELLRAMIASKLGLSFLPLVDVFAMDPQLLLGPEPPGTAFWAGR
jgi:hypothetical protein